MSDDTSQPQRPTTDDRTAWHAYWQAQGMPWRAEPEPLPTPTCVR